MKVAVFGGKGSQTDFACDYFWKGEIEKIYCESMHDVCSAVESRLAEEGILPTYNTVGGDVKESLKALKDHQELEILEKKDLEIAYHLAGKKKITLKQVKKVLSHWQSLRQAEAFFQKNIPHAQKIVVESSAAAAQTVSDSNQSFTVCVCHHQTAQDLGLVILASHIEPEGNKTTFVRIAKK